jgi:membrane-bound metal-dependent hydrolase YbcI (DUF457 family)
MVGFTIGVFFEKNAHLAPVKKIGGVGLCGLIVGIAPGFDAIPTFLGVPCGSFFGHRGFFHSPFFYLFFAPLLAWLTLIWAKVKKEKRTKPLLWLTLSYLLSGESPFFISALIISLGRRFLPTQKKIKDQA